MTGNPVRDKVLAERASPYPATSADETFNLLVFGGSQGARFFAEFMPKAMAELPEAVLKKLRLAQQCRPEDMEAVKAVYE